VSGQVGGDSHPEGWKCGRRSPAGRSAATLGIEGGR